MSPRCYLWAGLVGTLESFLETHTVDRGQSMLPFHCRSGMSGCLTGHSPGLWVSAIIYPYLKGEIASSFPFRVTHCYQHPAKEALGSYTCHFSPLEDQTYGLHCFFSPYLGKSRRQPWITQAPVLPTGICFLPWSRIVPHMWLSNQKESFLVAVLLGLPSPTCVKVEGYCEYFYTLSCVLF